MEPQRNLTEGVTPTASVFNLANAEEFVGIKIERTEDVTLITSILSHPEIKDLVSDDGEVTVPLHPQLYYLLPKIEIGVEPGMIEERVIGCLAFVPINHITWNPHIAILPQYRGIGTQAMELGMKWMFKNTRCKKLIANVPEYNVPMLRVFEKCDFKREGYSPDSLMKNGQLHGRILMGRNHV